MKFTQQDIEQIQNHGLSLNKVEEQLRIFDRGNLPVNIYAAATTGDGINEFGDEERDLLARYYEQEQDRLSIIKFVPASGAATRMFKALHAFLEEFDPGKETIQDYLDRSGKKDLKAFFNGLENLPFYGQALNNARESQPGINDLSDDARKYALLQTMLFSPGLNLGDYPKGLVPFHNYGNHIATAFEEHLYEAANYASVKGVARIHFTISKEHQEKFLAELERIKSRVEAQTHVEFDVSFSYQDPKTDTIAVDENNSPFCTQEGKLLFRPGGHGALIENLNSLLADIVFIKNIDNVVIAHKAGEMAESKKMLGGRLLQLQEKCFGYLKMLEERKPLVHDITEIRTFIEEELYTTFEDGFEHITNEKKVRQLQAKLNRPLRVCGMVKNEGEPGGGPFLVIHEDGTRSLQIIEGAQIDDKDPQQKKIAQDATHFNPVDIVCGIKNYKGEAFDLSLYVDPTASFIAEKTYEGKALKALELPGLWNGAMAKWNTVFVEVPVSTFNPVKTVVDLLKPTHQPE
ncbi:MAG: DUF4301 family protein [Gillisia sp.]